MIHQFPIIFPSGATPLAGCFYRNTTQPDQRQPAIVITGSWLTVRNRWRMNMPASSLRWVIRCSPSTFAGFGQSGGDLRQTEIPARKIKRYHRRGGFLSARMSFVQPGAVGYLGICASAQYVLAAMAAGARIDSFVSVAGWFHDAVSVTPF